MNKVEFSAKYRMHSKNIEANFVDEACDPTLSQFFPEQTYGISWYAMSDMSHSNFSK